ncbi:bZIP transcription factor [Shouchella shacheensis]|uniref:bZIP transcription factor n=1 Tax=Shouchella shacheensis TaxID=1649580 RepID=UPI00073FBCA7|nr:bZIP transcription factor [Shouchella shacheensis]
MSNRHHRYYPNEPYPTYYPQAPPMYQQPVPQPLVPYVQPDQPEYTSKDNDQAHVQAEAPTYDPPPNVFDQVTQQMKELRDKLDKVEQENEELKEKVENIKTINIENINYKIQELTVQELSGSLMIGMTSLADAVDVEKLMNDKGNLQFNDIDTEDLEQQMENQQLNDNNEGSDPNG